MKLEAREASKANIARDKESVNIHSAQSKDDVNDKLPITQQTEDYIEHDGHNIVEIDQRLFCDFSGCLFCTTSSSNLTQHLRVHNDEKTFECPTCSQKFRSSSNLKVHIKSIHTKEKVFT